MHKTKILGAALAGLLVTAGAARAETHGCTCVQNQTPLTINYSLQWGDAPAQSATLAAGYVRLACWKYPNPNDQASPPLKIQFNTGIGHSGKQQAYTLNRVKANNPQNCDAIQKQYWYAFQRTNNNNDLTLIKVAN